MLVRSFAFGIIASMGGASHADSDEVHASLRMQALSLVSRFDAFFQESDAGSARDLFCDRPSIAYVGVHLAISDIEKGRLPFEELFTPAVRDALLEYKFTKRYLVKADSASSDVSVSRDSEPRRDANGEEWTLFQSFKIPSSGSRACIRELQMLERDF
jgi:hypothetical protein